jgi:putative ABC transport system substrate-binding protein
MAYPTDRRSFVVAVGAATFLATFGPRAQGPALPVIGYLGAESPAAFASRLGAFRQGLAETGYVDGRNVGIEFRWAEGQHSRLTALAAELVSRRVDVDRRARRGARGTRGAGSDDHNPNRLRDGRRSCCTGLGGEPNSSARQYHGSRLVKCRSESKTAPVACGGNIHRSACGDLVNPTSPTTDSQLNRLEAAARELKVQIDIVRAAGEPEFGAAFDRMRALNAAGLVVASDTYFALHSEPLAALALKYRLPAITQTRDFAIAGGLMSYGGNFFESHRIAGVYTARLIKGARPADLPVQQVKGFEFFINVKTAKTLGIKLPMDVLAAADTVIE